MFMDGVPNVDSFTVTCLGENNFGDIIWPQCNEGNVSIIFFKQNKKFNPAAILAIFPKFRSCYILEMFKLSKMIKI